MKLLVAGSRKYKVEDYVIDRLISEWIQNFHLRVSVVISGGAEGVDTVVEYYANREEIPIERHDPKYDIYGGKRAPIMRNIEMVKEYDGGIVIWNGKSPGSEFTINELKKYDKLLEVILID